MTVIKISEETDTTHFPDGSKTERIETLYSDGSKCIIEEAVDKHGNVVTKETNIPPPSTGSSQQAALPPPVPPPPSNLPEPTPSPPSNLSSIPHEAPVLPQDIEQTPDIEEVPEPIPPPPSNLSSIPHAAPVLPQDIEQTSDIEEVPEPIPSPPLNLSPTPHAAPVLPQDIQQTPDIEEDVVNNLEPQSLSDPEQPQSQPNPEQYNPQTSVDGNTNACFSSWSRKKKMIFLFLVLLLLGVAGVVIYYFLFRDKRTRTRVQKAGFEYTWSSEAGFFVAPTYSGTNEVYYKVYDNIRSLGDCADQCKSIKATSGYWDDINDSTLCICYLASECLDRQGVPGGIVFSTITQPSRCEMEYCDYFPDDTIFCGLPPQPTQPNPPPTVPSSPQPNPSPGGPSQPTQPNPSPTVPSPPQPNPSPGGPPQLSQPNPSPTVPSSPQPNPSPGGPSQPTQPNPSPTDALGNWEMIDVPFEGPLYGREANYFSGTSVSLSADGNVMAIGEPGANNVRIIFSSGNVNLLAETINAFGNSTSLSDDGSIIAIGASSHDEDRGLVYVVKRTLSNVERLGRILFGDLRNDKFGHSVSLSGDGQTLVVGAYQWTSFCSALGSCNGYVRVYDWNEQGSDWVKRGQDLTGNPSFGLGGPGLGYSVSVDSSGQNIALGSYFGNYVDVYKWDTFKWERRGNRIVGSDETESSFGFSVSLSSFTAKVLAVGAYMEGDNSEGAVYFYEWNGSNWEQRGDTLRGYENENFGRSVALSGNGSRIIVGGRGSNHEVKTYEWNGITWNQFGDALDGGSESFVALSDNGNICAVGSRLESINGKENSGRTSRFQWTIGSSENLTFPPTSWPTTQFCNFRPSCQWQKIGGLVEIGADWYQSMSVSEDLDTLVVGSESDDYGDSINVGSIETFFWSTDSWVQMGPRMIGQVPNGGLGATVSLSGDGLTLATVWSGQTILYHRQSISSSWNTSDFTYDCESSKIGLSSDGSVIAVGNVDKVEIFRHSVIDEERNRSLQSGNVGWTKIGEDLVGLSTRSSQIVLSADGLVVAFPGATSKTVVSYEWNANTNSWFRLGTLSGTEYSFASELVLSGDGKVLGIGTTGLGSYGIVKMYQLNDVNKRWDRTGNINYYEEGGSFLDICSLSLSYDGRVLAIGNPDNDNNYSGSSFDDGAVTVHFFDRNSQNWGKVGDTIREAGSLQLGRMVGLSQDGASLVVGEYDGFHTYRLPGAQH